MLYGIVLGANSHYFLGNNSALMSTAAVTDPDPKSCAIQKQNSGMINTHLNGGGADQKITPPD